MLIAGFVVGGEGTSGAQTVLVRGSGPALAAVPFDLAGTLPDPVLALNDATTGQPVATNRAWGGTAAIASASTAVGAFPWSNTLSHDAALLESLPAGNYTAEISGESADTGIALAEVYDATPGGSYTLATPRLVNLSARVQVGTGANAAFTGFAIEGSTAKTVLIRASGPALAAFGLLGTLSDPKLTLNNLSTFPSSVVATNAGWAGDTSIAAGAAAVGAFPWGNSSNDSAILITLAPGSYTAAVTGASGDTGIALIEVYEVP